MIKVKVMYKSKMLWLISVICLFYSTCLGSDIITGTWVIKKEVYSAGYISRAPRGQEKKLIGKDIVLGENYINFKNIKYENLVQKVNVLSDDEIFQGWRISLTDVGVSERSVKMITYEAKSRNANLPFSEFILTPEGALIAISEIGLLKMDISKQKQ